MREVDRARQGGRLGAAGVEPALDELLDDPIMALLWRGDRLDPARARAAVQALRVLVRHRERRRLPEPDLAA
ncbi:MAG TPA: hypothetical protein VFY87_21285 [Geminicoccaceae bacterium]|nr:hypothetical protein [Geminicoccaceae bacterium]